MQIPYVKTALVALSVYLSLCGRSHAASPELAGTLSIIPGLGQISNGDTWEGLGWAITSLGLYTSGNFYASNIGYKIWQYNMYDAYRDAGPKNAGKQNVLENYTAFLDPTNIIDPVGAGILGFGAYSISGSEPSVSSGPGNLPGSALFFGFVGLGEEGLFRGFLFPAFSDALDSKWGGAIVSSALFSVSHLTNSASFYRSFNGLGILFLGGMALCWQTDNNDYDLRHSIFTHTWYDVIVDFGGRKGGSGGLEKLGAKFTLSF